MKPVLIIQNCPIESGGTILEYLNQKALPYQSLHSYQGHDFPKIEDVSAVICLGTPVSVNEYHSFEYLKNLYRFVSEIVRNNQPYLGLCFGGQLLARVLGAKVERNKVMEIGTYQVTLTDDGKTDPLFENFPDRFDVFHWHGDTFKIPFNAKLLAEGVDCKNQAFRKERAVGLQFHFEALPTEIPAWCDAYADEMETLDKTKEGIIEEYSAKFESIKKLNFQLLDNFFKL